MLYPCVYRCVLHLESGSVALITVFRAQPRVYYTDTLIVTYTIISLFLIGPPPPNEQDTLTDNPSLCKDKIVQFQPVSEESSIYLPDVRRNNIRIKKVVFAAACVANASVLGLPFEVTFYVSKESPFFQVSVSEDVAKSACQCSFRDLKEHLRP